MNDNASQQFTRRDARWYLADPGSEEIFSGWQTLLWGLFLLLVQSFGTTPSFRVMRDLGSVLVPAFPEAPWGVCLVVVGAAGLYAQRKDRRGLRLRLALIAVIVWAGVWLSVVFANWRGTGTVIYGVVIARYAWVYARLRLAAAWPGWQPPRVE